MKRERRRGATGESPPSRRSERVASGIQRVLGTALVQEIRDPLAAQANITHVNVSPDLRQARVYFALLSGEEPDPGAATDALTRAIPFLRRQLAEQLDLRFTPNIQFVYDEQLQGARRIQSLLKSLHEDGEE